MFYCRMAKQDSKTRLRTRRQITMNIWKQQTTPPTYKEMICLALSDLKQNKGSPRHVILNYICDNFDIKRRTIASRRLNAALKTGVSDGTFRKSKGTNTILEKYFIGDMKGLGTHKITTKLPKKALCVKTKTAKVTKSEPIQNKRRIRSKQRERSDQNMRLVNSQMTLKRNIRKERKVSKQVSRSESQVTSTYKVSKHRKVSQQGTLSKSQVTPRRKSPKQRKVNQQGTLSKSQLISKRKSPRQGKVSKQWTLSKSHVTLKRKSP